MNPGKKVKAGWLAQLVALFGEDAAAGASKHGRQKRRPKGWHR